MKFSIIPKTLDFKIFFQKFYNFFKYLKPPLLGAHFVYEFYFSISAICEFDALIFS